jgi:hypothetical protein
MARLLRGIESKWYAPNTDFFSLGTPCAATLQHGPLARNSKLTNFHVRPCLTPRLINP